jgi:hypothetical protein
VDDLAHDGLPEQCDSVLRQAGIAAQYR